MRWSSFIENFLGRKQAKTTVLSDLSEGVSWDTSAPVLDIKDTIESTLEVQTLNARPAKQVGVISSLAALASGRMTPQKKIKEDVKNKTDKILFSDDTAVLSEIMKQIMISNETKGEVANSRSDISGAGTVTVVINGGIKKWKTIERICMDILKKFSDGKIDLNYYTENEVKFRNFSIWLKANYYGNQLTFEIRGVRTISDDEFVTLREIFEKYVIANANLESSQRIDETIISDRLWLNNDDIVSIEEKYIDITAFTEENSSIEFSNLLQLANEITRKKIWLDKTFISVQKDVFSYNHSDQKFNISVTSENIHSPVEFDLTIKKNSIVLTVKLPNVGFDRKFLSNILEPFFKEVCHLASVKNKESISSFLIRMGVQVREVPEGTPTDLNSLYESNGFVGYEDVKEHLENGVINAWYNKEKYEEIAKAKYKNIKDIIPNAVLFEGPAGTGKTTLANIIGSHLQYPFVYIPLNSFMSKWYGEAEQRLAMIFEKIGELAELKGGAVIMIDEIDEIGSNRENSSEASGKITGVLLKKLDGMERIKNILLIGATNRKNMLDPALMSRFKYSQFFRLPNESEIAEIVAYYLPELVDIPHEHLTPYIDKISGRHIKNVCEDVTRIAIDNEIKGIETDLLAIFIKSMARSINQ